MWLTSKLRKSKRTPWNKGIEVGQRDAFSTSDVTRIKKKLTKEGRASLRDLALFSTAIDTRLRAPDLLGLTVKDVTKRNRVMRNTLELAAANRGRGMQYTLSKATMSALDDWIIQSDKKPSNYLFTKRTSGSLKAITARQFSRLVKDWAAGIGLDQGCYGIESLRRTRSL
jgi:integrase